MSFSRSGSTVLGQKLNNHSDVRLINESWIFNHLGILNWRKLTPQRQAFLLHLLKKNEDTSDFIDLNSSIINSKSISVKSFFKRIVKNNTTFIGEKTPTNIFYFDYIKKRMKDAKFIFLKRHPLAVAASYYKRWYSSNYTDDFLVNVVSTIIAYYRNFDFIDDKNDILQVKYEDLVRNSKAELEKIATHIGFSFEDKMIEKSSKVLFRNQDLKQYHKDSSQPLNTNHLDKYKKTFTKEQLNELSYLLRNEMQAMGYEFDEKVVSNKRLELLNLKIQHKISNKNVRKRRRIKQLKLRLSYLKYNLFN